MKKSIIAVLALILTFTLVMSGCSAEKKIIGSWISADSFINVEYTFNEDSTGTIETNSRYISIKNILIPITHLCSLTLL